MRTKANNNQTNQTLCANVWTALYFQDTSCDLQNVFTCICFRICYRCQRKAMELQPIHNRQLEVWVHPYSMKTLSSVTAAGFVTITSSFYGNFTEVRSCESDSNSCLFCLWLQICFHNSIINCLNYDKQKE